MAAVPATTNSCVLWAGYSGYSLSKAIVEPSGHTPGIKRVAVVIPKGALYFQKGSSIEYVEWRRAEL
jgi:hypothetical protein